ncbi:MAG: hypothetical protein KKA19_09985, partial [Candidatus Margulisbacteria bacterium]|nr:hypothetical protein [Candidatus Margulisiibacteriota bacterium]
MEIIKGKNDQEYYILGSKRIQLMKNDRSARLIKEAASMVVENKGCHSLRLCFTPQEEQRLADWLTLSKNNFEICFNKIFIN